MGEDDFVIDDDETIVDFEVKEEQPSPAPKTDESTVEKEKNQTGMRKCSHCPFETKKTSNLKRHIFYLKLKLVHKLRSRKNLNPKLNP